MKTTLISVILLATFSAFGFDNETGPNNPVHPALKAWSPVPYYVSSPVPMNQLVKKPFTCDQTQLFPTHADQNLKLYHLFDSAEFDLARLKFDDPACLLSSRYKNSAGQYYCQRSDIYYTTIISDTYRDRCGNIYRGYWRTSFLKENENMGTLFAKGRTMYPKPNATFPGDVQLGGTYPTEASEFLFFSELLAGDVEGIKKSFVDNQKTILRYNPQTLLFEER